MSFLKRIWSGPPPRTVALEIFIVTCVVAGIVAAPLTRTMPAEARSLSETHPELASITAGMTSWTDALRRLRSDGERINRAHRRHLVRRATPVLASWLEAARDHTADRGSQPIPGLIRDRLAAYYDPALLDRVRFVVDPALCRALRDASFHFGKQGAIPLIDIIVFDSWTAVASEVAWARQIALIDRFERWGTAKFARRYLESWRRIARMADRTATGYAAKQLSAPPPVFTKLDPQ